MRGSWPALKTTPKQDYQKHVARRLQEGACKDLRGDQSEEISHHSFAYGQFRALFLKTKSLHFTHTFIPFQLL